MQIIFARDRMCSDIIKTHKPSEEPQEPPPHACKLDSIIKSPEELDIIRTHFVSKYSFLFEDNPELATKLSESQAHLSNNGSGVKLEEDNDNVRNNVLPQM